VAAVFKRCDQKGNRSARCPAAGFGQRDQTGFPVHAKDLDAITAKYLEVDKGGRSLVETIKSLNAMNITPRGMEMRTLRMSMLLESIVSKGPAAIAAFGALGVAVGGVALGMKAAKDAHAQLGD